MGDKAIRIWDIVDQRFMVGTYTSRGDAQRLVDLWNGGRGYGRYYAEYFDENTGEEIVCSTQS